MLGRISRCNTPLRLTVFLPQIQTYFISAYNVLFFLPIQLRSYILMAPGTSELRRGNFNEIIFYKVHVQGYLPHKKTHPPRTLPYAYAYGLMGEVPLYMHPGIECSAIAAALAPPFFRPAIPCGSDLTTKALEGGAPAAPNLGKSRGAKQIFARADIAEPGCRVMEQRFSLQRPAETLEPLCYPEAGSSWPGWPEASYQTPSTKLMTTSRIETSSGSFFFQLG